MNYQSTYTIVFLFLFTFLISGYSKAQSNWNIKGTVTDGTSGSPLYRSTITALKVKDSTLVKFTRASENGNFTISGSQYEKMFLLITYPGHEDHVVQFSPDEEKKDIDFNVIKLFRKEKLLEEVIIKGKAAAVKIKKDTTEFNASSYTIKPNAKVEDLLRQLPGIQVDQAGKITAQGKKVNKVLVDGEEFFGDDPTLVTKNIRGDMVSKVQLYDKKSDQAAFTGIDDRVKEKTINIKLKEDAKNGYFGQFDVGGGTRTFYNLKGMINYFKRKQKLSAYGILSNTGKISLGWEDNQKYGSADDIQFDDAGRGSMTKDDENGLDAQSGQYTGEGIPTVKSGGLHYDTKWNDNKESVNINYKNGSIGVDGSKNTITQNNLVSGIISSNSDQSFSNGTSRQKLDLSYQIKPDSTSSMKISVAGNYKKINNEQFFNGKSFSQERLLNTSLRTITNKGYDQSLNADVFLTKRLRKVGRTLSANFKQSFGDSKTDGYLRTHNEFLGTNESSDSLQVIDQYKNNSIKGSEFTGNLTYTEPLSSSLSLVLSYTYGINKNTADRKTFNLSADGQYTIPDAKYSSHYTLTQRMNVGGAIFNLKKEKTTINFGTKIISMDLDQFNWAQQSSFKRNFINWNPQANISYQISPQKQLEFGYLGSTIRPTFDQMQPVRINNDPLNIITGNPLLKPSFNNGINISYYSYRTLIEQNLYVGVNFGMTSNPIINTIEIDDAGKSIYRWENLEGKKTYNYSVNANYRQKLKFIGMTGGLYLNATGNTYYSYANNVLNKMQSNAYSGSFTLSSYDHDSYQGSITFGPTYTTSESSLQKEVNNNGWGLNGSAYVSVQLPGKIGLSSDVRYEYRGKTSLFNINFNALILNAQISKKFLKSESLNLSLSANDLLNQNTGFNRSINGNVMSQTNFTTIKRYFMLSLTWDVNKMGGDKNP
ncbi:outer membrane beta-barrel family protein [Chryseobacterium gossypii]|uniref:outer membrane beta-barrel family protein n=1 Tax=Chryseobacterium gossypii TaxID=3231602 RepID=UPI0035251F90